MVIYIFWNIDKEMQILQHWEGQAEQRYPAAQFQMIGLLGHKLILI